MDSKKVFEKLFKIAENQQKALVKLAQMQGAPGGGTTPSSQPAGSGGGSPSAKDKKLEGVTQANLQRLLGKVLKVTRVHVAGSDSGRPEVHVDGEGTASPQQVGGAVIEGFLYEGTVPTVYYNGQVVSQPGKKPAV